jgi:hypothetical protein
VEIGSQLGALVGTHMFPMLLAPAASAVDQD